MSYFGEGGAGEYLQRSAGRSKDQVATENAVPSEREGSGPAYRIDPGSDDVPGPVSPLEKATKAARSEAPPAPEFAEIRGQCSVSTLETLVHLLTFFPDQHSSLEFRLSRPAPNGDNGETLHVVTTWKSVSPP
jgi:hypothetical protein